MKKLILIVLLLVGGVVSGQSVTGTSGLIHIPSARMLEDGQLVIGQLLFRNHIYHRAYEIEEIKSWIKYLLNLCSFTIS